MPNTVVECPFSFLPLKEDKIISTTNVRYLFPRDRPLGLLPKGGHGIFNVRDDLSRACWAHEGETCAQTVRLLEAVLTRKSELH